MVGIIGGSSGGVFYVDGDRLPQLDDEGVTIRFSMVGSSIATVELYGFGSPINIGR